MSNFIQKYPTSFPFRGQTIAYTSSSVAASSTFSAQTYQIRLAATSACHYRISDGGSAAAADNTSEFLPANTIEYVRVNPGQSIAAIRASGGLLSATDGTLWVTELT